MQIRAVRRVTHQAMDGVAPTVGDAAEGTAGVSKSVTGGKPALQNASIPLQREWQRQVDLLTQCQAPLEFCRIMDQHFLPGERFGGNQAR